MRQRASERGAFIPLFAVISFGLLSCVAFAVNGFLVLTFGIQQHNSAEYAGVAALNHYIKVNQNPTAAASVGQAVLGRAHNRYVTQSASPQNSGTVVLGQWNGTDVISGSVNAAKVTVSTNGSGRSMRTILGGLLGASRVEAQAETVVLYSQEADEAGEYPFRIIVR